MMNAGWRKELFESKSPESGLNPLGFPMSIAQGARILDICYRTWKRWSDVAITVPEYKLQQIQMEKKKPYFGVVAPVTCYQVWVVGCVGEVFSELPHGIPKIWLAQTYLDAKKEDFSRAVFQAEVERYLSLALNP